MSAAASLPVVALILPVGISFYTFESMSYVIDIYRGVATPAKSYLDYACFISFFPHLVAGPIIRYSDMLHQFRDVNWVRPRPDWSQVNVGLLFFTIGMAKKLLIADIIAQNINPLWAAFGAGSSLGMAGSWAAVLGYTFRIYFDFSAYSDMAVGIGHMFAVKLPQNFNSPYKATDPIDFWRRWHISLSSWLRDYLYFPLGGNRNGKQVRNLMITMLLGGLWHGAAWLFVIWGAWHGLLLVVFHKLRNWGLVPEQRALARLLVQSPTHLLSRRDRLGLLSRRRRPHLQLRILLRIVRRGNDGADDRLARNPPCRGTEYRAGLCILGGDGRLLAVVQFRAEFVRSRLHG